jgi:recombination associated protein RdgC
LGALKGSISYSKFYVTGELPDGFRDRFVERVRLRAFQPLTPDGDAEPKAGWCSIENPLDCELDHGKIFWNTYLNLGFRIDRFQIPAPLFKAHLQEAEREHREKRGRQRLGRREKEELRAIVARRLRQKLLPVMKVVDLSWNLETGVLRFWSQSPGAHEALEELFEDTFERKLVPESPFTAARSLGLSEAHERAFETLKLSVFHTPCPSGDLLWTSPF